MNLSLLSLAASLLVTVASAQAPRASTTAGAQPETVQLESVRREIETPAVLSPAEAVAVEDLKSRLWEAVRGKSPEKFLESYSIEERFDTPENAAANRKRVAFLLEREITEIDVFEITQRELVGATKVQNGDFGLEFRYSLPPRKILRVRYRDSGGQRGGQRFFIGDKDGKWHIITMRGQTT